MVSCVQVQCTLLHTLHPSISQGVQVDSVPWQHGKQPYKDHPNLNLLDVLACSQHVNKIQVSSTPHNMDCDHCCKNCNHMLSRSLCGICLPHMLQECLCPVLHLKVVSSIVKADLDKNATRHVLELNRLVSFNRYIINPTRQHSLLHHYCHLSCISVPKMAVYHIIFTIHYRPLTYHFKFMAESTGHYNIYSLRLKLNSTKCSLIFSFWPNFFLI